MNTSELTRREALQIGTAAFLGATLDIGRAEAAGDTPKKLLYFTKSAGYEHSVVKRHGNQLSYSEKILIDLGKKNGFEVTVSKDGRIFDGDHLKFDAYAFYTSGDLTKVGPDKAPAMSREGKQALLDAVLGGKGFMAIHAGSDSFHSPGPRNQNQTTLDPYIAMLGGEFVTHGAQQTATMTVVDPGFPGMKTLGSRFKMHEEWYALKNFAPDLHVLLVNETLLMKGAPYQRPLFPATWARRHGKGNVFYTSMGHREDVWTNPTFQSVLLGGVSWITGRVQADVPANIQQVTPEARVLGQSKK